MESFPHNYVPPILDSQYWGHCYVKYSYEYERMRTESYIGRACGQSQMKTAFAALLENILLKDSANQIFSMQGMEGNLDSRRKA